MVMSMAVMLGAARGRRFSIPDRSGHLFRHARRHPRRRPRRLAPVDAGRHTDQLGEASAEGAQRRAADRETDLGDAQVATAQQRHRALDAPRHQVGVRGLAVGAPKLAAEVPAPSQSRSRSSWLLRLAPGRPGGGRCRPGSGPPTGWCTRCCASAACRCGRTPRVGTCVTCSRAGVDFGLCRSCGRRAADTWSAS
jgi:hypothetical protein